METSQHVEVVCHPTAKHIGAHTSGDAECVGMETARSSAVACTSYDSGAGTGDERDAVATQSKCDHETMTVTVSMTMSGSTECIPRLTECMPRMSMSQRAEYPCQKNKWQHVERRVESVLDVLPEGTLAHVGQFLGRADLARLAQTCKTMRRVVYSMVYPDQDVEIGTTGRAASLARAGGGKLVAARTLRVGRGVACDDALGAMMSMVACGSNVSGLSLPAQITRVPIHLLTGLTRLSLDIVDMNGLCKLIAAAPMLKELSVMGIQVRCQLRADVAHDPMAAYMSIAEAAVQEGLGQVQHSIERLTIPGGALVLVRPACLRRLGVCIDFCDPLVDILSRAHDIEALRVRVRNRGASPVGGDQRGVTGIQKICRILAAVSPCVKMLSITAADVPTGVPDGRVALQMATCLSELREVGLSGPPVAEMLAMPAVRESVLGSPALTSLTLEHFGRIPQAGLGLASCCAQTLRLSHGAVSDIDAVLAACLALKTLVADCVAFDCLSSVEASPPTRTVGPNVSVTLTRCTFASVAVAARLLGQPRANITIDADTLAAYLAMPGGDPRSRFAPSATLTVSGYVYTAHPASLIDAIVASGPKTIIFSSCDMSGCAAIPPSPPYVVLSFTNCSVPPTQKI